MRLRSLLQAGFAALILAGLLVACDENPPTAPTPPPPQPPVPQAPPSPALTRVEVAGPASVPPGETAQYTATASFADGSTRDVTAQSTWRIQPRCCPAPTSTVLSVSSAGLATGHEPGEATVFASFGGRSSSKTVLVLPAGTFKLSGGVVDQGESAPGVRIAVVAGPAAGLETVTDSTGYRLYGVSGEVDVRATKPGYLDQTKRVTVTSNHILGFSMVLSGNRENVEGTYTLTIAAAPECRALLPAELHERRYEAVLTQDNHRVTATLEGTTFYTSKDGRHNAFRGVLEPERLRFGLDRHYYYYYWGSPSSYFPSVFEQLTGSTYFEMFGSAVLTGSSSRRSGTFNGTLETRGGPPRFERIASCVSTDHRFELTR